MPVFPLFKQMVRHLSFDVCEMAVVTFLMAKDRGVPLVLIPAVVVGRLQHPSLVCAANAPLEVADLVGRRVGVRSYSQTSGAWVRGFLQNDYGLDLSAIRWVTFEDAHVAGYSDPPWAERAPAASVLASMLLAGELDAAIAELPPDPRLQPVFPDPAALAAQWAVEHCATPVNHMMVMRADLAQRHPWMPSEIYRLLRESKMEAGLPADGYDPLPFGISANANALDIIAWYAFQQGLVSRRYTVDQLFDETTRHLGI